MIVYSTTYAKKARTLQHSRTPAALLLSGGGWCSRGDEEGCQHQQGGAHELDEHVQTGARRVLERVSHRVPRHAGLGVRIEWECVIIYNSIRSYWGGGGGGNGGGGGGGGATLWASLPLPPCAPVSTYFLALSHAPARAAQGRTGQGRALRAVCGDGHSVWGCGDVGMETRCMGCAWGVQGVCMRGFCPFFGVVQYSLPVRSDVHRTAGQGTHSLTSHVVKEQRHHDAGHGGKHEEAAQHLCHNTQQHNSTTAHSTQHTAHSTQHTTHSTQHTAHNTQHTTHSTKHTAHSTQHTAQNTQHTADEVQHAVRGIVQ